MAKYNGTNGLVKISATTVAELNSWEFTDSINKITGRAFGATLDVAAAGVRTVTGSLSGFYDPNDTGGQDAIVTGATVALNLYMDGSSSGDDYHEFTAVLIESVQIQTQNDQYVTFTANFHANALPTLETVS